MSPIPDSFPSFCASSRNTLLLARLVGDLAERTDCRVRFQRGMLFSYICAIGYEVGPSAFVLVHTLLAAAMFQTDVMTVWMAPFDLEVLPGQAYKRLRRCPQSFDLNRLTSFRRCWRGPLPKWAVKGCDGDDNDFFWAEAMCCEVDDQAKVACGSCHCRCCTCVPKCKV